MVRGMPRLTYCTEEDSAQDYLAWEELLDRM